MAQARHAGWHTLSVDLVEAVLLKLEPAERHRLAGVCRQWRDIACMHQRGMEVNLRSAMPLSCASTVALLSAAARRPYLAALTARFCSAASLQQHMPTLAALLTGQPALKALSIKSGSRFELPPYLPFSCSQLTKLKLSRPRALPDWLGRLSSLKQLTLHVSMKKEFRLPHSITQLSRLERIMLIGSGYDHVRRLGTIFEGLGALAALPALRWLHVEGALVEHPGHQASWAQGLARLKRLELVRCLCHNVDGPPHDNLAFNDLFMRLTQLRYLDLSFSELEELPEGVAALRHLAVLKLGHNGMEALPGGAYQRHLRKLHLTGTLDLQASDTLPVLAGMSSLTALSLSGTPLDKAAPLRELLTQLPNLRWLGVSRYVKARTTVLQRQFPAVRFVAVST